MVETKIWLFLGVMTAAAVAIPFVVRQIRRRSEEQVVLALSTLEGEGWVVEDAVGQNGRPHVRIWGVLEHPVALQLQVKRRGRLTGAVGASQVIGVLDPGFDRTWRVVCSEPERAGLVFDPDVQNGFTRLPKLELRLGSAESLLPPDYWRTTGLAHDRRLRRLWMVRIPGKHAKLASRIPEIVDAARALAHGVTKHCPPPGTPDRSAFETKKTEAWL